MHDAPGVYKVQHPNLVLEFKAGSRNFTSWPKHLLVRYQWQTENDVDLDRGLYLLFAIGVCCCCALQRGSSK